ncbi:hypothetical protein ABQJ54_08970 [Rhodanobacter sp. Si-c]|uniref:DUF4157 domain-containing protein n=1 Tax=Rhodanobacter lycopersici TaxID=3162487 RepID=A0ABV3QDH2_9GAMM
MAAVQAQTAPTQNATSDTQRDADQQQRIDQGLKSGQLNTRQASNLEQRETNLDRTEQRDMCNGPMTKAENAQIPRMQGRQAHVDHMEHVAGTNNGRVGPREQKRIQRADNRNSKRIYRVKHNQAKR